MANPPVDLDTIARQLAAFSEQLRGVGHVPHNNIENRVACMEDQVRQMQRDIQAIRDDGSVRLMKLETQFANDHSRAGNTPIPDPRSPLFALRDVRTGQVIPGLQQNAASARQLDDAAVDEMLAALDWVPGNVNLRTKQDFLLVQMGWTGTFAF
ncbi:hypothetical protein BKA63DRAFT_494572 [Paraphoma chrysanthemicola]|nr:hypothetical protein BKA63DRAFT_494572 [Paraphoma chrysanthemicola]